MVDPETFDGSGCAATFAEVPTHMKTKGISHNIGGGGETFVLACCLPLLIKFSLISLKLNIYIPCFSHLVKVILV